MNHLNFTSARLSQEARDRIELSYSRIEVTNAASSFRSNVKQVDATFVFIIDLWKHTFADTIHNAMYYANSVHAGLISQSATNEEVLELIARARKTRKEIYVDDKSALTQFVEVEGKLNVEGQISLMSSMIVGTWTALEVLLEDLWERAINFAHQLFPLEALADFERKGISFVDITEHEAILSGKLGSFLKSKFRFDSFDQAFKAYELAFSKAKNNPWVEVKNALRDRHLTALNLLRNLIVHSAGIVDTQFMNRSADVLPLAGFRSVGPGRRIPIEGQAVSQLISQSVLAGCDLLKAVNDWISVGLSAAKGGTT